MFDHISHFTVSIIYDPFSKKLKDHVDLNHHKINELIRKKASQSLITESVKDYYSWALRACHSIAYLGSVISLQYIKTGCLNFDWLFLDAKDNVRLLLPLFHPVMKSMTPSEFDLVAKNLSESAAWCLNHKVYSTDSQMSAAYIGRQLMNYSAGVIMFYILFGVPPFEADIPILTKKEKENGIYPQPVYPPSKDQQFCNLSIESCFKRSWISTYIDKKDTSLQKLVNLITLLGDPSLIKHSEKELAAFDPLLETIDFLESVMDNIPITRDTSFFLAMIEEHANFIENQEQLQVKAYLPSNIFVLCDNSKKCQEYQILLDGMVLMNLQRPAKVKNQPTRLKTNTMWGEQKEPEIKCKYYFSETVWIEVDFTEKMRPIRAKFLVDEKNKHLRETTYTEFLSSSYRVLPFDSLIEKWNSFLIQSEKREVKEVPFSTFKKNSDIISEYSQASLFDSAAVENQDSSLL